jgi:hypothetical protein
MPTMQEVLATQAEYDAALARYVKDASSRNQRAFVAADAVLEDVRRRALAYFTRCLFGGH